MLTEAATNQSIVLSSDHNILKMLLLLKISICTWVTTPSTSQEDLSEIQPIAFKLYYLTLADEFPLLYL